MDKQKTKKVFSIYIDEDLADKIRKEASAQSRKISAQVELYLYEATRHIGEKLDTKEDNAGRNDH